MEKHQKKPQKKVAQIPETFTQLHPQIKNALSLLEITSFNSVQSKCFPLSLSNTNFISSSYHNSGKSTCLLSSVIHKALSQENQIPNSYLVISPVRERATELYNTAKKFIGEEKVGVVFVTGGANRKKEYVKLVSGEGSIVIGNLHRIVEHLEDKKLLKSFQNIQSIFIDDVDLMIELGYNKELQFIMDKCIKENIMFEIYGNEIDYKFFENFNKNIKYEKVIIDKEESLVKKNIVSEQNIETIKDSIHQGYIILPQDKKTQFLITFLKKYANNKIVVSFSSIKHISFFACLLNFFHINTYVINQDNIGEAKKQYQTFTKAEKGILLCSNLPKIKLNLPLCDWALIVNPPNNESEYLRYFTYDTKEKYEQTKILLLLFENEKELTNSIKNIKEYDFNVKRMPNDESKIIKLVNKKDHFLYTSAFEAYNAFLFDYAVRPNKEIFNIDEIDEVKMCKNFGFENPPYINLTSVLPVSEKKALSESKQGLKRFHISSK